jgi:hypothetical protein
MNKFSNYKISFRSPYITIFNKIIYICVANFVPINDLGVCSGLIAIFYKFSETAKSAGEMTKENTDSFKRLGAMGTNGIDGTNGTNGINGKFPSSAALPISPIKL